MRLPIKDPNVLLRIGLIALVLGSVSSYLLRHTDVLPDFVAGFLTGLFYGIAIPTLLMSIARRRWMTEGGSRAVTVLLATSMLVTSCATAPHPTTIPVEGGTLFVDDGGRTGVPIVFIHGNGANAQQWRAQLAHFRGQGRRAVAIDLPGFGRSTAPASGDFSLNAMASAIDRAVDGIRLPRFVLVGHSYAGAVVATYAAAHPEKVAGVVYLDAAGSGLSLTDDQKERFFGAIRANKMQVVRGWFAPMLKGSTSQVQEEVLASVEKTPTEVFVAALMSLTAYDAQKSVAAYTGPRLAIAATDVESPLSFHKQFPDVRTVAITGAGHWVMLDRPAEVNAAIEEFVGTVK